MKEVYVRLRLKIIGKPIYNLVLHPFLRHTKLGQERRICVKLPFSVQKCNKGTKKIFKKQPTWCIRID
jgi:hypothetical protein